MLPLEKVDEALSKTDQPPPRIRCLEAVAESTGYSPGVDNRLRRDLVPVLVNPNISDGAAQVVLSSSVFRESVSTAATLMIIDTEEMTASEWLRLLTLLMMRCSSSIHHFLVMQANHHKSCPQGVSIITLRNRRASRLS